MPALVGGSSGQLFSNMIAFHMQKSLNWSLAAALAAILLGAVLLLYWLYDRLIGIDNMKLSGRMIRIGVIRNRNTSAQITRYV